MDFKETYILPTEFFTSPHYKISRKFVQRGPSFSNQTDG